VLAAGRGERMRPLSDSVPKPLLSAGGKALIEWQIERLARAGFGDIVINHAHLGHLIEQHLGDGARLRARLIYSPEAQALETAGGIAQALPLLGPCPFAAVNADIYCEFDLTRLRQVIELMQSGSCAALAHLVLVDNPPHHPLGDYALAPGGTVVADAPGKLTFSGIGAYRPALFERVPRGAKAQLATLLGEYIAAGRVTGEYYGGRWIDVGTPARLEALRGLIGA
jgi:MurNAc alpha-1-phosphate uridylyltransferase